MPGILGDNYSQGGILGMMPQGGLLSLLGQQPAAPAYGSDQWAMQQGGPNVMLWREIMRGLSSGGLGALAPENAGTTFSDASRSLLAPPYQAGKKG